MASEDSIRKEGVFKDGILSRCWTALFPSLSYHPAHALGTLILDLVAHRSVTPAMRCQVEAKNASGSQPDGDS